MRALVDQAGLTGVLNLLAYVGQGMPFAEAFERAAFTSYAEFTRGQQGGSARAGCPQSRLLVVR